MNLSVILPLFNEESSIEELYERLKKVVSAHDYTYELLFIDDGSTDSSWCKIQTLSLQDQQVRAIRLRKNIGKSYALQLAFQEARGQVVITMDTDLQDFPEEIPELYEKITREDYDLICGWKKIRKDPWLIKILPSLFFNWVARKTSGLPLHDFNCGIKAYKSNVIKHIDVYGEQHRYLPILVKQAGFLRITEKIVQHQPRKYGQSKFGNDRFLKGFLDLLTLWFISHFGKRPMHFFGIAGSFVFLLGFFSSFYIGTHNLYKLSLRKQVTSVTENPWFYISLACMIIGTQLFLAGFLGEMLIQTKYRRVNICKIIETHIGSRSNVLEN
ncbi:glycosyltransferase family 2 protein [Bacteroidetes bacterium endosymbiont of Geopemphigus sp.]|uniref:glycosyltransferase family 2 protein n=1 Tax=Bacteroidetes bacterium endosymbiont of Geopemphigus sp. TaxID=2047937 RepID=UPI000CD20775|nr:glycosyltransferase family 2 protein [Bacteroidetes bacterium endosymbiont of Geopemphigus sp.]